MKNIYLLLFLLILGSQTVFADNNRTEILKLTVNKLSEAFEKSDIEIVKEHLSSDFAVSIASYPSSERYYLKRLIDTKSIKSVTFQSVEKTNGDTTIVNVQYIDKDGKEVKSTIAFNSENKILFSDYLDRFYSRGRYQESTFVGNMPFTQKENENGIILEIKLNGSDTPLKFMFDSGANGMAISPEKAESVGIKATIDNEAQGVSGIVKTSISENNTVHLTNDLSLPNQRIAIIPGFGDKYDGIIGLNIAKQYIVNVDFDAKQINLHTFGDYTFETKGHNLSVTVPDVIILPATVNIVGKKEVVGDFVFDTGANYTVIAFQKFVRKNRLLLTGFKAESEGSTTSLGVSTPVFHGKAFQFKLTDDIVIDNIPITLQASSNSNNQPKTDSPDGSLGINFISQYNFTIDLLRKIIHLAPRK